MAEPWTGQITMWGCNFAPRGWAFCDGQLMAISQNDALFSLLGTIYGGDGRTTFGLPDLRGRTPISSGTGPGLSPRPLGQKSGAENVTLTANQIPSHSHTLNHAGNATTADPTNAAPATPSALNIYGDADMNMQPSANTGGSRSHSNIMPYETLNFCIALFGIYPSRN